MDQHTHSTISTPTFFPSTSNHPITTKPQSPNLGERRRNENQETDEGVCDNITPPPLPSPSNLWCSDSAVLDKIEKVEIAEAVTQWFCVSAFLEIDDDVVLIGVEQLATHAIAALALIDNVLGISGKIAARG